MPDPLEGLLTYFASLYRGTVEVDAFWQWAGGGTGVLAVDSIKPLERWRTAWQRAGEVSDERQIALLREVLFDRPGDQHVLGYLRDAIVLDGLLRAEMEVLARCLTGLSHGPGSSRVAAALLGFDGGSALEAFAALAPAIDGQVDEPHRDRLVEALQSGAASDGAIPVSELVESACDLQRVLADGRADTGVELTGSLDRLRAAAAALTGAGESGVAGPATEATNLLRMCSQEARKELAACQVATGEHPAAAVLGRKLELIGGGVEDPRPPRHAELADACLWSIRATRSREDGTANKDRAQADGAKAC